MNTCLVLYLVINFIGGLIFVFSSAEGIDWEELFNPYRIYKTIKVNWFGAWALAIVAFICITPFALAFYAYKICTIGR